MADPNDEARWRAYLVDGSDTVLKNAFNYESDLDLHDVEMAITNIRALEIKRGQVEIPQTFDADHMCAIHSHLFADVYPDWAGTFRDVGITKANATFIRPEHLEETMARIHDKILEMPWASLDDYHATDQLGRIYGSVNSLHPFREGNGRTARLFMTDVAYYAGWRFDEEQVGGRELVHAAKQSYYGHHEETQQLFSDHSVRLPVPPPPRPTSDVPPADPVRVRELFTLDVDRGESLAERLDRLVARRDPLLRTLDGAVPIPRISGPYLH